MTGARAFLFDLDGTLVDSEGQTAAAIALVMARHGVVDARLPHDETRGRTWTDVVAALAARYPRAFAPVARAAIERELVDAWAGLVQDVTPIPGAVAALSLARAHGRVAVVSSSPRALVERLLTQIGARASVEVVVAAEDVTAPKPAPDGFLRAARALDVPPPQCVVFEDSRAGLTAARGAGMRAILVLHRCGEPEACRPLATSTIEHFAALPVSFWAELAA